ncbi:ribonuclease T [Aurantiacibacter sp. MUD11]|uniref:ribonuclease T2 family protein n=1 Tax=Aurantiacibacter sp. MUD11 TaxID=3003265 RepID=UPI0022AAA5A6|nr:ribonuclease T [Aurantiacibacter sp. MUD11]WAT17129.1 ribonuclease T [Aurantiacibacter sp. MUD11]
MLPRSSKALIALAALALPAVANAQAYQCSVPQGRISLPQVERDGPVRETRVTGYTLALSWSPEFCRFREDAPQHARQCSGRAGRFAFIVHGLWPDGPRGSWPQWCPTQRQPSMSEVRVSMCMTPDVSLLAREWAKHGSCMTSSPDAYLRITRILWNSLRWPDFDRLSRRRGLTAGDIRRTFAEANPYWDAEDVGLVVSNRGWLREMRLCYGADFMPTACDARRYGPDDDEAVSIWRGL